MGLIVRKSSTKAFHFPWWSSWTAPLIFVQYWSILEFSGIVCFNFHSRLLSIRGFLLLGCSLRSTLFCIHNPFIFVHSTHFNFLYPNFKLISFSDELAVLFIVTVSMIRTLIHYLLLATSHLLRFLFSARFFNFILICLLFVTSLGAAEEKHVRSFPMVWCVGKRRKRKDKVHSTLF